MTSPPSLRRFLITVSAAALALLLAARTSGAQTPPPQPAVKLADGVAVPLLADPDNKNTRVERTVRAGAPRTATFIVSYNGFSPQAQAAFQAAVDIWATRITSAVPIRITANWTSLGTGILGSAGPTQIITDFPNAPVASTWYPIAIANKLAGADLAPASADISCSFNSTFSNWYYGTDGLTPSGTYDLMSVIMHEIGHGLGFIGSMRVNNGDQGSWGQAGLPFIYDRFTENSSGADLLTSTTLGADLLGLTGGVYWNGADGVGGAGGIRPRLYTPGTWSSGSSYSHLDEATYAPGNANSLMTPRLGQAEAIHDPGPITIGMLEDSGWGAVPGPTPTPGVTPTPTPAPTATPGATPPPKPGAGTPAPTASPTAAPTASPTSAPTTAPTPAPTPPSKPGSGGTPAPAASPTPAPTPQPKPTP